MKTLIYIITGMLILTALLYLFFLFYLKGRLVILYTNGKDDCILTGEAALSHIGVLNHNGNIKAYKEYTVKIKTINYFDINSKDGKEIMLELKK
jgi:hypothetical protein